MSGLSERRLAEAGRTRSPAGLDDGPSAAVRARSTPSRLGRYELLARIASGGMASVHLARLTGDAGFARTIAIKLLHRHLVEDPDFVAMFQDEASFAARIRHPNVVDVYDVEWVQGELIIVMEYVEGASLQALVRAAGEQGRELARGCLLRVLHDALRGLHAAHELCDDRGEPLGLVHRDVSPQNILVGVDGVARVTDFGVAKARGRASSTRTGMVKGKLHYLAPEQLRGQPIDRRVDLFAAGVVLWECLTDRALFRAENEAETMMQVLQKSIPPPSTYAPGLGIAMDRVCLRALERDPARRFPSAAAFADALEQAARDTFFEPREVGDLVETLRHEALEGLRRALRGGSRAPGADDEPSEGALEESTTIEVPQLDFGRDDDAQTGSHDAPTRLHPRANARAPRPAPARPPEASEPTLVLDAAARSGPAPAPPPIHMVTPPVSIPRELRGGGRAKTAAWIAAAAVAAGAVFVFALAPSSPHEPGAVPVPVPESVPASVPASATATASVPASVPATATASVSAPATASARAAAPATTPRAVAKPAPPRPKPKGAKPAATGSTPFMPPDI